MSLNFFKTKLAKLTPDWQKVKQAAIKNLILVLWLTGIYLAVNFLSSELLRLLQMISPSVIELIIANQIIFSTLLTLVVWGIVFVALMAMPKIMSKRRADSWLAKTAKTVAVEFDKLGYTDWPRWRDIGLAISGVILAMLLRVGLVMLVQSLFPSFDASQQQELGFSFSLQNSRLELITVFILLAVLVPVIEETVFRGYLFGKVRSHSGFLVTALVVSLLFGLAHFTGGGWVSVVVTFSLAIVMCLTREVSGSIYPSILMHMINNSIAFVALLYLPMLGGLS